MFAGTGCCGQPRERDRRPSTHPASAWVGDDSVLAVCRGVADEYSTTTSSDGRRIVVLVIWGYDPVTQVQDYTFIERISHGTSPRAGEADSGGCDTRRR